jgi:hypothetical protein
MVFCFRSLSGLPRCRDCSGGGCRSLLRGLLLSPVLAFVRPCLPSLSKSAPESASFGLVVIACLGFFFAAVYNQDYGGYDL